MPYVVVKDRKLGVVDRHLAVGDCPECCGGTFCRAVDCCVPGRFAWFKSSMCGSCAGTVKYGGACWSFTGEGPHDQNYIAANFPRERVYTVNVPCFADCNDPQCPDCGDDCCYESAGDPSCVDNDCDCMKPVCKCGHKWTVAWTWNSSGRFGICQFPGTQPCEEYLSQGIGSMTWEYREVSPGICDLVLVAYSGTLLCRTTVVQPCSPIGVFQAIATITPANVDFVIGLIYGCGSTWRDIINIPAVLNDYVRQQDARAAAAFYPWDGIVLCSPTPVEGGCNQGCQQTCTGQPGFPGSFYQRTSTPKSCFGQSMHETGSVQCDLDCVEVGNFTADFSYTVHVDEPCGPLPPHDVTGGIGGVEAPPPDVGSLF